MLKEKIKTVLHLWGGCPGKAGNIFRRGKWGYVYNKKQFVSIMLEERLNASYSPCRNGWKIIVLWKSEQGLCSQQWRKIGL